MNIKKNIDLMQLDKKLRLLCEIYTMYIHNYISKPQNTTDNKYFF